MRIAFWRVDFAAAGPGAALGDILAKRPNAFAMAQVIAGLKPDVLVLSGVDYDSAGAKAAAFRELVADQGHDFRHLFAPPPNSGRATEIDMNGDGLRHGPDDAQGYGAYSGARALLLLSKYPLQPQAMRDFSDMLWRDLPKARLFSGATPEQLGVQRLSSSAHLEIPVILPGTRLLRLLVYHAGPPLFGFHPDRNLNRNHDETAFWSRLLSGELAVAPPTAPFILVGGSNLDPFDGDGVSGAMQTLLADPELQDPRPASTGGAVAADPAHLGPPELDTVDWDDPQGNLRVSYVLPSSDLHVRAAGVLWPLPETDLAKLLEQTGSAHKPVWVDLALN